MPITESCALVSVHKRMVLQDSGRIGARHVDKIEIAAVGRQLKRTRESGLQQSFVAHAGRTAVQRQEPIMDGEDFGFLDPSRIRHFASAWRVFR